MKTVRFQYQTELVFSSPASEHCFLLRILPQSDSRQKIKDLKWSIDPVSVVWRTSDGFGNDALSGYINEQHNYFRFGIEGFAEVSEESFIRKCEGARDAGRRVLLYSTELTGMDAGLEEFYNRIDKSARETLLHDAPRDLLESVQFFSHAVHDCLRYERGVTKNATTAQQAFDLGAGVCQDYAHILLALLRKSGVPCRYVVGLASDYGETHAWVEALIADRWYGIDPTRDKLIDEGYIALSRGRDFADCSVERGVFTGLCRGTQTITLDMNVSQ